MPPQPSVLQVALVPGELPQSAPPEGALPIIFADRVVGWSTPTVARVEDAEAVAAFRAMDVPLGWRVRAVLEPVPSPPAALVFGSSITSVGEAVSAPAALAAGVDVNGPGGAPVWQLVEKLRGLRDEASAHELAAAECDRKIADARGRLADINKLSPAGDPLERYTGAGGALALASDLAAFDAAAAAADNGEAYPGLTLVEGIVVRVRLNGAAGGEAEIAGAIDRSAT